MPGRATKSRRLFTRHLLSLHSQCLRPQAEPPRWVFKSWVGHAGDIGGVSIYRGSSLRPLAQEAACVSTIMTKVLTTIRCSAVQNPSEADRSVHVHHGKM